MPGLITGNSLSNRTRRCQRSAVAVLSIDVVLESMSCGTYISYNDYLNPTLNPAFPHTLSPHPPPGVVIFRLYALWECNRRMMWAMAAGFVLAKIVLFPFAGVGIAALRGEFGRSVGVVCWAVKEVLCQLNEWLSWG